MDNSSGVGVLDKAAVVLSALESGPATLAGLVAATGLARPDRPPPRGRARAPPPRRARHAGALHARPATRRTVLGRRRRPPARRGRAGARTASRHHRGVGAVVRRQGDFRVCVAAAERPSGLRDSIPVGSQLSMLADRPRRSCSRGRSPTDSTEDCTAPHYNAATLSSIRRRGWAQSVGEREPGVASVSAGVRSPSGKVIAAVSVSGPLERMTRQPGRMHAPAVLAAAERLSESLRRTGE